MVETINTASEMPKKSKNKSTPAPAPITELTLNDENPTSSPELLKQEKDNEIKNATAKELIMSTLAPGSEPWKIAESMENASDIWKALEARYAPNKSEHIYSEQQEQDTTRTSIERAAEEARVEGDELERRKQAQARATREFYESMPNPDQRLLWALLHGGKPETEAWFNGTSLQT